MQTMFYKLYIDINFKSLVVYVDLGHFLQEYYISDRLTIKCETQDGTIKHESLWNFTVFSCFKTKSALNLRTIACKDVHSNLSRVQIELNYCCCAPFTSELGMTSENQKDFALRPDKLPSVRRRHRSPSNTVSTCSLIGVKRCWVCAQITAIRRANKTLLMHESAMMYFEVNNPELSEQCCTVTK